MSNIIEILTQYEFVIPEGFEDYDAQEIADSIAGLIGERWPERLAQFDYKGIEERDAYASLIQYLFEMACEDMDVEAVSSSFDEITLTETVTFTVNEQNHLWRFNHQSKYLDKDLFVKLGQLMHRSGAGMFVEIFDEDCEQLAYVPRDLGQALTSNPFITPLAS